MGDLLDSRVAQAKANLDVLTICENPDRHEEELDAWMARLGITPQSPTVSTGTVRIMRTSPEPLTIVGGTQFVWNDEIVLITTSTYKVSDTAEDGVLTYKNYNNSAYSVDIPVECSQYSGNSISSGTPLNWVGAPADVYDVYVGSAISGGSRTTGAQEKARAILDALTPDALSGEACIRKSLRRNFPDIVADVVTGDKDINKPYAVSLYVKPVKGLQEYYIPFTAAGGKGKIPGCGVYKVLEVLTDSKYSPFDVSYPANSGESGSEIDINISYTGFSGKCEARVLGFPEYAVVDSWLKAATNSTPFEFNLKPIAVGVVKLYISSTGAQGSGVKSDLAATVSSLSINSAITDDKISSVLSSYDMSLNRSVVYSAEVFHKNNKYVYTMSDSSKTPLLKYMTTDPVALYSQANLVEIIS